MGIRGIGTFIPPKILTNSDLEKTVNTSNEWIKSRTGIKERRIVESNTKTSDIGANAALEALRDANLSPSDIDLIVVATLSPDMIFPATACIIQEKIGANRAAAFDISAACAGFTYGLAVATQFIAAQCYETVLLIGAEATSRLIDWSDRNTCVLFGDGAGAVILQETDEGFGILENYLASNGKGSDLIKLPAGGSALPATYDTVEKRLHYLKMNGNEVFKFAVRAIPEAITEALKSCNLTIEDIDFFIPHQANQRIIDSAISRLNIDPNKVVSNLEQYGNTSTASVPLALNDIYSRGILKSGDLVLLVGFGAGLTWGANIIRWHKNPMGKV